MAYFALPYPLRLKTFSGYWDQDDATARQLAALGHVYDRPPLEALEEGSRCLDCSKFVPRDASINALDGSSDSYEASFSNVDFHHQKCTRRQIRIPLEPNSTFGGLYGGSRISDLRKRFETVMPRPSNAGEPSSLRRQTSSLFSLPVELRLEIYLMILPKMDSLVPIVQLNSDSPRVVTSIGNNKTGPRDLTKANILQTCKVIHDEASEILFAKNTTYKFANTKTLYLFLRQIGPSGRTLLKSVDVQCGFREDAMAFALLAACTKIWSLTVRLPRHKLVLPFPPLWMLDGMACLLSISGLDEVRIEPCAGLQSRGPMLQHLPSLNDEDADATILRRELMRPKNSPGSIRWVDGHLDI